jgi:lipopolysaccharide biosynthesis regulator YciM
LIQLDEENQVQEAIHRYMETLKVIQESCADDNDLINQVHFQLGKSYQHLGDIENSIKYLESYLQYCKSLNNVDKAGEAEAVIATCYEK